MGSPMGSASEVVPSGGRPDQVKTWLNQVLGAHVDSVRRIEGLESQVHKLKKEKMIVFDKGKSYQEKYDKSVVENKKLLEEIENIKHRFENCPKCELHEKQWQTQKDMYERLVELKDKEISRLEEDVRHLRKGEKQTSNKASRLYTQDSETLERAGHRKDSQASGFKTPSKNKKTPTKNKYNTSASKNKRSQEVKKCSVKDGDLETESQQSKKRMSGDNTRNEAESERREEVTDKDLCMESEGELEESVRSPAGSRRSSLKLTKFAKRARCRYSEEPLPDSKKARISPGQGKTTPPKPSPVKKASRRPDMETQVMAEVIAPPVLVPETCADYTIITAQTEAPSKPGKHSIETIHTMHKTEKVARSLRSRSQKERQKRPNIVIPETVPMDFELDTDDESEEDGSTVTLPTQPTIRQVLSSPPSHSSTPHRVTKPQRTVNHRVLPEDELLSPIEDTASFDVKVRRAESTDDSVDGHSKNYVQEIKTKNKVGRVSSGESLDNEGERSGSRSPVFNRVKQIPTREKVKSVGSPSLFDEDDEVQTKQQGMTDGRENDPENPLPKEDIRRVAKIKSKTLKLRGPIKKIFDSPGIDTSVQSNPSPSVLTGKPPVILSSKENISNVKSSSQQLKAKPKASSSKDEGNGKRMVTRRGRQSQERQQQAEETASPLQTRRSSTLSHKSQKLVQTTMTQSMFQPKRTSLSKKPDFNGGKLGSAHDLTDSSLDDKEQKDLEEALKRSLQDQQRLSQLEALEEVHSILDPNLTSGPQLTSTPFIDKVCSKPKPGTFKKPSIPKKLPTTPRHKTSRLNLDSENLSPRRSPRLKKHRDITDTDTVDPEATCLSDQGQSQKNRSARSRRTLQMDETGTLEANTVPPGLNGSIDPNVHLSEYDSYVNDVTGKDLEAGDHYDRSYAEEPEGLEAVSFLELGLEEAESQAAKENNTLSPHKVTKSLNQRSQNKRSPDKAKEVDEDSDDIELTCKSVVFGPGKKRGSRSGTSHKMATSYKTTTSQKTTTSHKTITSEKMATSVHTDVEGEDSCPDIFSTQAFKGKDGSTEEKAIHLGSVEEDHEIFQDSFDRVPEKEKPNYAYQEVVRKQNERQNLKAYSCYICENYFREQGLSESQVEERLQNSCRHRARYVPPETPEHFWSIGFPDTQECQERGYMNTTQARPSKYRRKRGLQKLFQTEKEEEKEEDGESSEIIT